MQKIFRFLNIAFLFCVFLLASFFISLKIEWNRKFEGLNEAKADTLQGVINPGNVGSDVGSDGGCTAGCGSGGSTSGGSE